MMSILCFLRGRLERVRQLFFPVKETCGRIEIPNEKRIQESIPYLQTLKNKYRGQRGFVIGNGPSLRMQDLEVLKNEITIASNKIYLAFSSVSWRPTIYTVADPLVWVKIHQEIPAEIEVVHVPNYLDLAGPMSQRIETWRSLPGAGLSREREPEYSGIEFSADVSLGMHCSSTITYENLQFAAHLGLSPIYIIGCDHFYAGETEVESNKPVVAGNANNHFVANYRSPDELVNPAPIHLMDRGYAEARLFSDRSGIEILNATRGGFLEAFPRVEFEALF